jgi:hypothetical protein
LSISLETLVAAIEPANCSILFGAGATVPSGAPTGAQLAQKLWKDVAKSEAQSDDLVETASVLVRRYGRPAVVDSVIAILKRLKPTGGFLGFLSFLGARFFPRTLIA